MAAFWTASAGMAIGHLETVPRVLSMPVKVESDDRISAAIALDARWVLKPGEIYSAPRSFVAVFASDYDL